MPIASFLHPWLLAGLVAVAAPLIIHLIGRRRAPTIEFAAFDFLLAVSKRLAKREKLRQILLLILRTLLLALLVFALARPMPQSAVAQGTANKRIAIVFDTSASMAYDLDGRTLLSRGKSMAKDVLSRLSPGDTATLVIAGAETKSVFTAPTPDLLQVRAAVDSIETTEGVADMGAAIETACAQLGKSGAGATLVIISDLSENSYQNVRPTSLDPPPDVQLIDVAERSEATPLGNVAIEDVVIERGQSSSTERRIRVALRNFGSAIVTGRTLELSINGIVTQRGYAEIPSRGVQEKVYTHTFPSPGVYRGEVRLLEDPSDGFASDDVAYFTVEVVPGVRALAINGDPRSTPYDDELFFLERALDVVPKGDAGIALTIVSADEADAALANADYLKGYDVVILANVGKLRDPAPLSAFVKNGGGVLWTLGNKVRFETANELFADLLPHPLRDVHLAADPAAGTPPLGIGAFDVEHPLLLDLDPAIFESLRASKTQRYFNLDVGADRKARVILRFDNSAPALIESDKGAGRLMMLTTSIDLDDSDIALRTAYPALIQRMVRYLAKAVENPRTQTIRVGGVAEVVVPTGANAVAVTAEADPDKDRRIYPIGDSMRVRVAGLSLPGFVTVEVARGDGIKGQQWQPEPRLDVAVNSTLDESDFMPVRTSQVAGALGGAIEGQRGRTKVAVSLGRHDEADPFMLRGFASYFLLALCLVFVGESALSARG